MCSRGCAETLLREVIIFQCIPINTLLHYTVHTPYCLRVNARKNHKQKRDSTTERH